MCRAFPGVFADDEPEPEWGPRKIPYEAIGALKVPSTLHTLAATQRWDRHMEVGRGA